MPNPNPLFSQLVGASAASPVFLSLIFHDLSVTPHSSCHSIVQRTGEAAGAPTFGFSNLSATLREIRATAVFGRKAIRVYARARTIHNPKSETQNETPKSHT